MVYNLDALCCHNTFMLSLFYATINSKKNVVKVKKRKVINEMIKMSGG